MKLYHGTSVKHLPKILTSGLKPRHAKKKSNWKDYPSKVGYVYLTVAYALYFAIQASEEDDTKAAIIEIDSTHLDFTKLCPDEDFIAQALVQQKQARNLQITHSIDPMDYQNHWLDSLNGLGNCCYFGTVPAHAITRLAIVDIAKNPTLGVMALDPTISLLNYQIVGKKYTTLLEHVFDAKDIWDQMLDTPEFQLVGSDDHPLAAEMIAKFAEGPQRIREELRAKRGESVQIFKPHEYLEQLQKAGV